MVAIIDSFVASVSPAVATILDLVVMIVQLLGILILIGYVIMLFMYDTKINIREYSKGGRIITATTRAMMTKDKKTGAPKLRMLGTMGFRGDIVNLPPAE